MAGKVSLAWNGILVLVLLISIIVLSVILNYLYVQQESNSSESDQNAINQFLALGIIEKLPNCSQPTLVGNGVCNSELDIPECDFDGNDCATTTTSTSTSTITTCPDWSKVSINSNPSGLHSSEIRGLRSMKCPSETLQNLLYFMYKKTYVVFFVFHFVLLYIFA